MPKTQVAIVYVRDDPECFDLAQQVWNVLLTAGWDVASPSPIPSAEGSLPTAMSASGQPSGVTVATHSVSSDEQQAALNQLSGRDWIKTPFTVLSNAIELSIGSVAGSGGGSFAPPEGTLRVVIAPRM